MMIQYEENDSIAVRTGGTHFWDGLGIRCVIGCRTGLTRIDNDALGAD